MEDQRSIIDDFIDYCRNEQWNSDNTLRAYRQDLKDLERYLNGTCLLTQLLSDHILGYLRYLQDDRVCSPATIKRRVACLKRFFSWLAKRGDIAASPFAGLDLKIVLPKKLPRALNRATLARILGSQSTEVCMPRRAVLQRVKPSDVGLSTYLATLLMVSTGVRVGELVRIRLHDVDHHDGAIRIHGKGNRERKVYVNNDNLADTLHEYARARLQDASPDQPLFVNRRGAPLTEQAFRLRLKKVGELICAEQRITPHMLRHTAATMLIEEGTDIRIVQRLLGHQSIATTEVYTHVSDASLRAALRKADPIGRMQSYTSDN